jgi:thiamine biosynthesis protein ThiI
MKQAVLIHYHEIALKGKNRPVFERKLEENIKKALKELVEPKAVRREYGYFIIQIDNGEHVKKKIVKRERDFPLTVDPPAEITERLKKVFGIAYLAFAIQAKLSINSFCKAASELLKDKGFKTFKVKTRRSDKKFPLSSQEINQKVGKFIKESFKKRVNLTNPDLTVYTEVGPQKALVYLQKIPGAGGLPIGTAGKVAALISAGFDSPVASWYLMKRGARAIFIHFHSYPFISPASIDQAKELVEILTSWQFESTLYLVPFAPVQKTIATKCPTSLRVLLYRRMMIRIAEMIAGREKARALVTGESLGQVASQTLPNIRVIDEAAKRPILRPLIGMDKTEIIKKARQIGTYEISVQPYDDCCSFLMPRHVTTAANLREVKEAEKALHIPKLTKDTLSQVEKQKFPTTQSSSK